MEIDGVKAFIEVAYLFESYAKGKVARALCGKRNCEHVRYAIQIPKVQRILDEKGLTVKPNGRIEPKTNLY